VTYAPQPEHVGRGVNPLPQLLDCKRVMVETGLTRAAAEALMRNVPVVTIEGLRKTYVKRTDVDRYLESRTLQKDQVQA
jgi:hypothetical protein